MPGKLTRRRLIGAAVTGAVAAACARTGLGPGFLARMGQWNELVEPFMFGPDRLAPELPPGAETPPSAFPGYFISPETPVGLKIGGMVARPATLSLEQLQRLPRADLRVRHHCVEGWSAVASWHGARLRDLPEVVGSDPRAGHVEFRSFDSGYWSSGDRESALQPQTILAYGMNGEPLGPDHGAPIRVYSAVKLGCKMVKYLTEVDFCAERGGGYWENQGYEWFGGL